MSDSFRGDFAGFLETDHKDKCKRRSFPDGGVTA